MYSPGLFFSVIFLVGENVNNAAGFSAVGLRVVTVGLSVVGTPDGFTLQQKPL